MSSPSPLGIHDFVSTLAEQQDSYVFCGSVHHPVFVHTVIWHI